jgi:hypothetical protein
MFWKEGQVLLRCFFIRESWNSTDVLEFPPAESNNLGSEFQIASSNPTAPHDKGQMVAAKV